MTKRNAGRIIEWGLLVTAAAFFVWTVTRW